MSLGIEITPGTFIVPDRNVSRNAEINVRQSKVNSFELRGRAGINPVKEKLTILFRNRTKETVDALEAFFQLREGTTSFPLTLPASGGGEETFYVVCESFNKNFVTEDFGYTCTANLRKVNIPTFDVAVGSQAPVYTVSIPDTFEGTTVQATITTDQNNGQLVSWVITGNNTTNGRVTTTTGSLNMNSLVETVNIVVNTVAGDQGTVPTIFTLTDAISGNTGVGVFNVIDTEISSPTQTGTPDFGYSVDLNSNYIVVGAPGEQKVYTYNISDGSLYSTLVPSGGNETSSFGRLVKISDTNQILVSAISSVNSGAAVYLFDAGGNLLNTFTDPESGTNRFGNFLQFTDDLICIGAPQTDGTSGSDIGRVHFYNKNTYAKLTNSFDLQAYYATTRVGTTIGKSPSLNNLFAFPPGKAGDGFFASVDSSDGSYKTFYIGTHDNTASIWNSHYDGSFSFTRGPTSVAMTDHHIFLGVPNLNRVAVWRYAYPERGLIGTMPSITGSFNVTNSGRNIDVGNQRITLIPGDAVNMPSGTYDGFYWRQSSNTYYCGNAGVAYITNNNTATSGYYRISGGTSVAGFPATLQNPNQILIQSINTSSGSDGGSGPIPGYTANGTYNLTIQLVLRYSHAITSSAIVQSPDGNTDVDFGRFVAVNSDHTKLYIAAPLETWSGVQKGTIYEMNINDSANIDFDRTSSSTILGTLNSYIVGDSGSYLGSSKGANNANGYIFSTAFQVSYSSPNSVQLAINGDTMVLGNSDLDSNQGKIFINPTFT